MPARASAHAGANVTVTTTTQGVQSITEGGSTVRLHIRFTSEPDGPVDLTFLSDGQVAADLPQRTMFPNQWGLGIDVFVSAIADGVLEGPHHGTLKISTRSSDADYDGITVAPIEFEINDADHAGVVVTPSPLQIREGGTTGTLGVRLSAQPAADVDLRLIADPAQYTLDVTALHFTPSDWNQLQTVRASAIDDFEHEAASTNTTMKITTRSSSSVYDQLAVTPAPIVVYDDDPASIDVDAPAIIQLDEAHVSATGDLAVRLTSKPTAAVKVIASELAGQLALTNPVLTFTPSNWNTTQHVTVAAVDDGVVEPRPHVATITLEVKTNDAYYAAMRIPSRTVHIDDNDAASIQLEGVNNWSGTSTPGAPAPAVRLDEGGAAGRVRLVFGSAPDHDLVIRPIVTPAAQLRISPSTLTVRAGQVLGTAGAVFDVTAVDDSIDEVDVHQASIAWTLDTADSAYGGMSTIQSAIEIGDNDTANVVLTPNNVFDTREGGAQRDVAVTLASAPTSPVVITMLPDAQATAVGATRTLSFDSLNWNVPQHIAIAALNDDVAEASPHPGLIAFDVASTDTRYNDMQVTPLTLSIRDDDQPGVLVTATGADTRVSEAGVTDVVDVRLTSRPTVPVTLSFSEPSGELRFPSSSVTLDPQSWNQEHLVELAAVQNDVLQGSRIVHVQAVVTQSADPAYGASAVAAPPFDVTIVDDEQPGIVLVQSSGDTTVTESGATDTYTIALAAKPTDTVTITTQADGQVKAAPSSLTFTPDAWKTPQDVTVSAVQDRDDEADPHTGVIHHGVQTTAAGWDTKQPLMDLGVRVQDDDTSSIKFDATDGSTRVVEGGTTDTVTMVLTSRPTANVEIVAKPDDQVTVSGSLVFTHADWDAPHTLTIRAIDDEGVSGDRTAMVGFSVRTTDAAYKVQSIPALPVTVVDNDSYRTDDEDNDGSDEDDFSVDPNGTGTPDRSVHGAARTPSLGSDGSGASSSSGGSPGASAVPGSSTVRRANAVAAKQSAADPSSGYSTTASTKDAVAGDQAANRAPSGESGGHKRQKRGPSIGPWVRKHVTLVAVVSGLLTITGVGGGWVALRNPTRAAHRAGRRFRSDRLQP